MLALVEWNNSVVDPVRLMTAKILAYLPVLFGALVILIVGWLVAKGIRQLVNWLLKAIRFDTLADKAGISEILKKGNLKISAGDVEHLGDTSTLADPSVVEILVKERL